MSSFAVHVSVCALLAVDLDNSKGGSGFGRFSKGHDLSFPLTSTGLPSIVIIERSFPARSNVAIGGVDRWLLLVNSNGRGIGY